MDELIVHVSEKTYAYGAIRAENQDLLSTISELKTMIGKKTGRILLLTGGRESNCILILQSHLAASSPFCIIPKATSTSHCYGTEDCHIFNFEYTINDHIPDYLLTVLPSFKDGKDHLVLLVNGEKQEKASLHLNCSSISPCHNQSSVTICNRVLKKHGLDECVSMSTPMATERLYADLQGTLTDQTYLRGLQFLGGKLVSWSSKKQDCTAMSTAEAEYTEYQLADLFTKALQKNVYENLVHRNWALLDEFAVFVRNSNMHNMGKTIGVRIQRVYKDISENAKGKGKAKGKRKDKSYIPKPKNPKPSTKEHRAKNGDCHHYKEVGHWKRNCPVYLAELMKNKKQVGTASYLDIFTIKLFSFPNKSWMYDTGCGTHIYIPKHDLRGGRKLEQGALYLYVGSGVHAQVEAIGSYDLVLPNGLVICLDNCHYAPTITRGVVSVSHLVDYGFIQCFMDYEVSFSRNNVIYLMLLRVMVFKNEVENHLRKTIKALQLDQGGKYISQEFKDIESCGIDYALESARILNMVPTKKVDKTPYELWYGKVPNLSYLKETMGCYFYFSPENKIVVPSEITIEVEGFEPPHEEEALVRRSVRTHRALERLCLDVEVEEHSLGDLNEPANYKATMLDPESNKWLDAMNAEMQSMKDNQVWCLVDLLPNETFSSVADIRATRIS
ncbi:retrotransposon protein, putative, ty1-copia subclass [Tanacetum coccineum]